jgi:phosphoribosyl 1,2-cyclic phosphodiesterase
MIQLCSIASGSSGNCIYIGTNDTHILVDAGISGKRIEAGLDSISVDPKKLDAILITHEHSDHILGLGVMARRYKMPIYTTSKTWNELKQIKSLGNIDESLIHIIIPDEPIVISDVHVMPFKTSHDAVDSVCYTFTHDDKKIGFATDLGNYDAYTIDHLKFSNLLYLEANHDIKMLEAGPYPYYLKRRILSDLGHLSNELSSQLISDLAHFNLEYVVLAHLSKENNHPDIAYLEAKYLIDTIKKESDIDIQLIIAKRDIYSEPVVL